MAAVSPTMAPAHTEHGSQAAQSSTTQPQPAARVRRRARKRDGPPQLQFLTATDLSQFKDENAKRSVRSQAMIQYRYKADQQKRKTKKGGPVQPDEDTSPIESDLSPVFTHPRQGSYDSTGSAGPPRVDYHAPRAPEGYDDPYIYSSTADAWHGSYPDEGFSEEPWFLSDNPVIPAYTDRYNRALAIRPMNSAAKRVIEYEQTQEHEEAQMRMVIAKFATLAHIGDGVDPFAVLPQFQSPELSSVHLVRTCTRAFVSRATIIKWIPVMLTNPHLLLSATTMTSTWLDMHQGCSGDSKRTALVKAETIGWINERLRNPEQQFSDATLMVILHLIAGEMWTSNEKTLRIHETGIARLISLRGGMDLLAGHGAVAEVAASTCLHADIICESEPMALFDNWSPPDFGHIDEDTPMPESPLFCPRADLYTLAQDRKCKDLTFGLLCDMRDLTDLVVRHDKDLCSTEETDNTEEGIAIAEARKKVAEIHTRLAGLPSAYQPHQKITNDWIYESCRIAAIIYASALISRVPLSVAAEPGRAVILANANMEANGHLLHRRLTEALYEVVERSNMEEVWSDMSGVLYWVTSVGAASARTPTSINVSQAPSSQSERYATWLRRCLIMFATRTMILLIFQHPRSILMAQKKLVRIQGILAEGMPNSTNTIPTTAGASASTSTSMNTRRPVP